MSFDLVIANGTVVTELGTFVANVGISNGRIAAIGADLGLGRETIDATGRLVLPGGVDAHVHLDQKGAPGIQMGDGFETGTRSAVCGGNTTVMPFCLQERGQSMRAALTGYHAKAQDNCYCDVSFHLIVSDPTPQVVGQELPALFADGYRSLKVFMTYADLVLTDYEIMSVMAAAREGGALVMVHAENDDAIRFKTEEFERTGRTAPYYHSASRPIPVEREATHRALTLAELMGVPVMIVHVSNQEAIEEIVRARGRGVTVYSETCPQYLVLTADDLDRDGMEGSKFVCSPPPRDVASQAACWAGIEDKVFDVFSSDHCPYRYDETGKINPDASRGYRWIPNGIPGVETRLPILFSEGVGNGRITLEHFVELTSTRPARLYGLYPQKGAIRVGADADIAIWEPQRAVTIGQSLLHHGCDYTPYEGLEVTGWPTTVLVRGHVMVRNGELVGEKGWGAYQRPEAAPAGSFSAASAPAS